MSNEKLIQLRIDGEIKDAADEAFSNIGISSQTALKMFMTQVARTGKTPFDHLFSEN